MRKTEHDKNIIVAMTDTVIITTKEYAALTMSRGILESIFSYQAVQDSYKLSEYIKAIKLVYERVITGKMPTTEGEANA